MTTYLIALLSAMFAAIDQQCRMSDSKDVMPDAKDVIVMEYHDPTPNPLDGFEPPPSVIPYVVPPATETGFLRR